MKCILSTGSKINLASSENQFKIIIAKDIYSRVQLAVWRKKKKLSFLGHNLT